MSNGLTCRKPGRENDRDQAHRPSSVIGTAVECYDFLIYGTASALVFNKLFFPLSNPALGTVAAFGTYAVGYLD
jgi:hypothetical protein